MQRQERSRKRVRVYNIADVPTVWLNKNFSRRIIKGDRMTITWATFKKNFVPAHKHDDNEMVSIILKGSITFGINGRKIVVKKGEAILIPPGVMHSAATSEDTIELCCFAPPRARKSFPDKNPLLTK